MSKADDPKRSTTHGVTPGHEDGSAPGPIDPKTGQHVSYWVLSAEELAKGFVRPVRQSYVHVGTAGPQQPLRDLTDEEKERFATCNYVGFEAYPESESPVTGRFWTRAQLDSVGKGCGETTLMGQKLAETYARNPAFYSATFCVSCRDHFPVGKSGEFVWAGSDERVGT